MFPHRDILQKLHHTQQQQKRLNCSLTSGNNKVYSHCSKLTANKIPNSSLAFIIIQVLWRVKISLGTDPKLLVNLSTRQPITSHASTSVFWVASYKNLCWENIKSDSLNGTHITVYTVFALLLLKECWSVYSPLKIICNQNKKAVCGCKSVLL